MRPYIITEETRHALENLNEYARKHPYSFDDLLDMKNGDLPPPGNDPNFVVNFPIGVKVVLSYEQQSKAMTRHISISVDEPKKLPPVPIVEEIIKLCGFEKELAYCHLSVEEYMKDYHAINVIEILEENEVS